MQVSSVVLLLMNGTGSSQDEQDETVPGTAAPLCNGSMCDNLKHNSDIDNGAPADFNDKTHDKNPFQTANILMIGIIILR